MPPAPHIGEVPFQKHRLCLAIQRYCWIYPIICRILYIPTVQDFWTINSMSQKSPTTGVFVNIYFSQQTWLKPWEFPSTIRKIPISRNPKQAPVRSNSLPTHRDHDELPTPNNFYDLYGKIPWQLPNITIQFGMKFDHFFSLDPSKLG